MFEPHAPAHSYNTVATPTLKSIHVVSARFYHLLYSNGTWSVLAHCFEEEKKKVLYMPLLCFAITALYGTSMF